VLTAAEQAKLEGQTQDFYWREVLIRFSVKEAIYKALDPFVRRYVDFAEVEVDLHPDGIAEATLNLKHGEGPFRVEARTFFPTTGEILTTARVQLQPD
jgi:4'-phosphopantetheinyl transferase EntD